MPSLAALKALRLEAASTEGSSVCVPLVADANAKEIPSDSGYGPGFQRLPLVVRVSAQFEHLISAGS